jgi:hypothetical protein
VGSSCNLKCRLSLTSTGFQVGITGSYNGPGASRLGVPGSVPEARLLGSMHWQPECQRQWLGFKLKPNLKAITVVG